MPPGWGQTQFGRICSLSHMGLIPGGRNLHPESRDDGPMPRQVAGSGRNPGRARCRRRQNAAPTQARSIAGSRSPLPLRHCWPLRFLMADKRSAPYRSAPYTEAFRATKFSTTGVNRRGVASIGGQFLRVRAVQPPMFIGVSLLAAAGSPVSRLLPNSGPYDEAPKLRFPFLNSCFRNAV
jgi:hypothetical protein